MGQSREMAAGAVFILTGGAFLFHAVNALELGSASKMGPGYFPAMVAVIPLVLGGYILVRGALGRGGAIGLVPWRGIIFISASTIVFALTARGLGLLVSVFLAAMIAAAASQQFRLTRAFLVSGALAAFCVLVFGYGLSLSLPTLGPWLHLRSE
jgi:hypothetical protein